MLRNHYGAGKGIFLLHREVGMNRSDEEKGHA
jgi:hypothetical protein